MVFWMLAERASQHVNSLREIAFLDDDLRPEGAIQRLLLDERAGAFDQVDECADDLRCQRQRLSVSFATQHAPAGVEFESLELIDDVRFNVVHGPARTV